MIPTHAVVISTVVYIDVTLYLWWSEKAPEPYLNVSPVVPKILQTTSGRFPWKIPPAETDEPRQHSHQRLCRDSRTQHLSSVYWSILLGHLWHTPVWGVYWPCVRSVFGLVCKCWCFFSHGVSVPSSLSPLSGFSHGSSQGFSPSSPVYKDTNSPGLSVPLVSRSVGWWRTRGKQSESPFLQKHDAAREREEPSKHVDLMFEPKPMADRYCAVNRTRAALQL